MSIFKGNSLKKKTIQEIQLSFIRNVNGDSQKDGRYNNLTIEENFIKLKQKKNVFRSTVLPESQTILIKIATM